MQASNTPWKFVVLEGIDGVGKTSIGKALSATLCAHYYKTPPSIFEQFTIRDARSREISLRQYIDLSAYQDPHCRFLFYLFTLVKASQEIRELLRTAHVVCDRYLSSALVYHWALHEELEWVDVSWLPILRPDHEYLLVIDDESKLRERLRNRNESRTDEVLENNTQYLRQVQAKYRKLRLREVDTAQESVEVIVERLAKEVLYGCSDLV